MVRQNNLCDRYQSFVQSHVHGVSTALLRAVRTVSLCNESYSPPPPASVVDIIYKMRDLENFEGGTLYRELIECIQENNPADSDFDAPTACSSEPFGNDVYGYPSSCDDGMDDEEQPVQDEEQPPQATISNNPSPAPQPPLRLNPQPNFLERQRQRAKRAFLSAVFIEGHKQASIEDLKETLRKHYFLGRDPFSYDAHTREPTGIGTKTLEGNFLPSLRSASARTLATVATPTTSNARSSTSVVVLYYYIF